MNHLFNVLDRLKKSAHQDQMLIIPEVISECKRYVDAYARIESENERLREQIKCGHSMELDALARERDELLVENERLKSIPMKYRRMAFNAELQDENDQLCTALAAAQAKIDSLMLEYCPDEMTPEQIENWGKHQKAVSDQTNLLLQLSP